MVVMGYVHGETAHKQYGNRPLPQAVLSQVQDAIKILHAENIVFGDIRSPDIMLTEDERVMLIDFDWCGVYAEGTYPFSLNDARRTR
ncbi:hypothetical protein BJV74DRAFT_865776 [Russula compacta]|nr:hypothetical protein BJV74DRAFT_865776 [Russula compacta]